MTKLDKPVTLWLSCFEFKFNLNSVQLAHRLAFVLEKKMAFPRGLVVIKFSSILEQILFFLAKLLSAVSKPFSFLYTSVTTFAKTKPKIFYIVLIILLATASYFSYLGIKQSVKKSLLGESRALGNSFEITSRSSDGSSLDKKMKINLTNANITNQILIQGKRAKTRKGKLFLIVTMELSNDEPSVVYSFPVDLIRLAREDKKFAPSVHQGRVEIRPTSTKVSNVGFVIEEDEKNFTLELGEISETKQSVSVDF